MQGIYGSGMLHNPDFVSIERFRDPDFRIILLRMNYKLLLVPST